MRLEAPVFRRIIAVVALNVALLGILSAETLTLAWDPNDPTPEGYRLRVGASSGNYDQEWDAGSATSITLTDLEPGTYYAAVFAYGEGNVESPPSNEIVFAVEAQNTPPSVELVATGEEVLVTLAWDPGEEPDLAGYRLYWGIQGSGTYPHMIDVGDVTTAQVSVHAGNAYAFVVTAYDAEGLESPPSAPVEYAGAELLWAPADLLLAATASDSDGSIDRVEFYEGDNLLGQVNAAPFEWNWQGVTAGEFTVTARAFDNEGASADSAPVLLTVSGDDGPPTFEGVPSDIVVTPDPDTDTATVSWVEPIAIDDVAVTVFGSSHPPGSTFAAGTTMVTYHAEDAAGNRTEVSFDVFVGSIDLWRANVFGAAKDIPEIAGNLANPDGDEWSNLEEYVMGFDPLVADGEAPSRFWVESLQYGFEFSRRAVIPDVVLRVESAPDPRADWSPLATLTPGGGWAFDEPGVSIEEVEKPGIREVTLLGPMSADYGFLRLTLVIEEP